VTLTLDPVIRHTVVHHSSTSTYIPNFIEIEETFCGRTDGVHFPPLILLGRLLEVDLNMIINDDDIVQRSLSRDHPGEPYLNVSTLQSGILLELS